MTPSPEWLRRTRHEDDGARRLRGDQRGPAQGDPGTRGWPRRAWDRVTDIAANSASTGRRCRGTWRSFENAASSRAGVWARNAFTPSSSSRSGTSTTGPTHSARPSTSSHHLRADARSKVTEACRRRSARTTPTRAEAMRRSLGPLLASWTYGRRRARVRNACGAGCPRRIPPSRVHRCRSRPAILVPRP